MCARLDRDGMSSTKAYTCVALLSFISSKNFFGEWHPIAPIWLEKNISRYIIGVLPYPSYIIISDVLPLSKSFLALNENMMAPILATQLRNTLSIEHTSQSFVLSPPSVTEIKHV